MPILVISVGGSAINPKRVNDTFLKKLKATVQKASKKQKIVIVTGGGFIARDYISALAKRSTYVRDVVGIHCTRLNANLVASYIGTCNQEIPTTLEEVKDLLASFNIVVCGGLRPGTTSDGTTASIADYLSAKVMINMTNVKGLYDKDPKKYKSAKFLKSISHKEFKQIVDNVHEKPGQHFVLDRLAARICRQGEIKVIILKGVANLNKYLSGKKFEGTTIS